MGREDLPVPWKANGVLEERVRFAVAVERGEGSVSALCEAYGISRETGHKWLRRWREGGASALQDGSRAPLNRPQTTAEDLAAVLLAKRREHPKWGARKLLALLREAQPQVAWPAASTAHDLLRAAGLVAARRRQRRAVPRERPFADATQPNDEWAIDFKGWFRTADGTRCDPLTVSDTASRMLLECRIMPPQTGPVAAACERLFRTHGLPGRIRMDNGTPFGSRSVAGLSRLTVGWLKLGIELVLIKPATPSQNGRHERMHGTLQEETGDRPAATPAELQAWFDGFRQVYNEVRPHEALGQVPPARLWRPSARPYPKLIVPPWYPATEEMRTVDRHGEIAWRGGALFIGTALAGEPIGLSALPGGDWLARFMKVELGVIERGGKGFLPYGPARPGRPIWQKQNKETVRDVAGL
jgi:transposase InsO family protein